MESVQHMLDQQFIDYGIQPAITVAQAGMLGIAYPFKKGWAKKLKTIFLTEEEKVKFLSLSSQRRKGLFQRNVKKKATPAQLKKLEKRAAKIGAVVIPREQYQLRERQKRLANKLGEQFVLSGDFYKSREWREIRFEVLQEQALFCACCGKMVGKQTGNPAHVDHIIPRSVAWERALDKANLQILCEDCNLGKSNYDSTDFEDISYVKPKRSTKDTYYKSIT